MSKPRAAALTTPPAGEAPAWRLFVAVAVPERVRLALAETQAGLKRATPDAAIRWAGPEQFHLTLRFLGAVAPDRVAALTASLDEAGARCRAFTLEASGIGFFPQARRPRVIWCGASDREERLRALHHAVCEATDRFTFEAPAGHFTGHITLGRVQELSSEAAAGLRATAQAVGSLGSWTVAEVELIRSQLARAGAKNETIHRSVLRS